MTISDRKAICFDAGHGGYNEKGVFDAGAVGPGGLEEAKVALDICLRLAETAKAAGFEPVLTRTDSDGSYYLTPRAALANDAGAVAFISVHCNSFSSPQARGTETFYARGSREGRALAECIQQRMAGLGLVDRLAKAADFTVLTATAMPAVLVETAFISNPQEEQLLADPAFRRQAAEAIWAGFIAWLNH